jgi:FkbM family methyltransferase
MSGRDRLRHAARWVRSRRTINRIVISLAAKIAEASQALAADLEQHGLLIGEVRIDLPNDQELVLWSDGRDAIPSRMWWRGWDGYDPAAIRPWFQLATRARTIVDIGANIGVFSLVGALANRSVECWAFEPMPETYQTLRRNVRCNPLARVHCLPCAVGASHDKAELFWDATRVNDAMATLYPLHGTKSGESNHRNVELVGIDEWADSIGLARLDLVKIDVERGEPAVLTGMHDVLARDRPDLLVEVLDDLTATALRDVVTNFNYRPYLLTPFGAVAATDITPRRSCLNYLLTTRTEAELATVVSLV